MCIKTADNKVANDLHMAEPNSYFIAGISLSFWFLIIEVPQDSALDLFYSHIYCLSDLIQYHDF